MVPVNIRGTYECPGLGGVGRGRVGGAYTQGVDMMCWRGNIGELLLSEIYGNIDVVLFMFTYAMYNVHVLYVHKLLSWNEQMK